MRKPGQRPGYVTCGRLEGEAAGFPFLGAARFLVVEVARFLFAGTARSGLPGFLFLRRVRFLFRPLILQPESPE